MKNASHHGRHFLFVLNKRAAIIGAELLKKK
jgi:hypothetical protein